MKVFFIIRLNALLRKQLNLSSLLKSVVMLAMTVANLHQSNNRQKKLSCR